MCKESQTKTALDPGSEEVFHLIFFPRKKRSWGQKIGQKIGTEKDWELCPPLTLGTKAKSYTAQKTPFSGLLCRQPTDRPTNQRSSFLHRPILLSSSSFSGLGPREERGRRLKVGHGSGSFLLLCFLLLRRRMDGRLLLLYYVPPTTLAFFLRPKKRCLFCPMQHCRVGWLTKKKHGGNDTA